VENTKVLERDKSVRQIPRNGDTVRPKSEQGIWYASSDLHYLLGQYRRSK